MSNNVAMVWVVEGGWKLVFHLEGATSKIVEIKREKMVANLYLYQMHKYKANNSRNQEVLMTSMSNEMWNNGKENTANNNNNGKTRNDCWKRTSYKQTWTWHSILNSVIVK